MSQVKVSELLVPKNGILRGFEKGKQEQDFEGNSIEGVGDSAYLKYYERKLSMKKELKESGYANHTPIMVYKAEDTDQIETEEGLIHAKGKYIVVDGVQRTCTAEELGSDTIVQINIISKARALELMVSANYHRKQNSPAQFTRLLKADITANPDQTVSDLAVKYSMSESTINRFLSITTLPEEISQDVGKSVSVQTAVTLAESIKKLTKQGNPEAIKNTLVLATKNGNLDEVIEEVEEEQKEAKRKAKGLKKVFVPLEPIYNAERARITHVELTNLLEEEPENEIFKAQLETWDYIHMISASDKAKHRMMWEEKHGKIED